jgi:hypothetical protein
MASSTVGAVAERPLFSGGAIAAPGSDDQALAVCDRLRQLAHAADTAGLLIEGSGR